MKMWLFRHLPLSVYRWPFIGRRLGRRVSKWQNAEHHKWRNQQPLLTEEEFQAFVRATQDD